MICLCLAEKAKSMMSNIFNAAELDPSNKECYAARPREVLDVEAA